MKSKDKLLFYYGFLISVMKCIPMYVEKFGYKYVEQLVWKVIGPFNIFVKQVLQEVKQKLKPGNGGIEFLDVEKLKNIVKIYLQLFCAHRKKIKEQKKNKQNKINQPFNNIFLYYLLNPPS